MDLLTKVRIPDAAISETPAEGTRQAKPGPVGKGKPEVGFLCERV